MRRGLRQAGPATLPPAGARAASAALAAALLLGACASLPGGGTAEEQVARLSEQRWAALLKRDFETAYAFNQPAYRKVVPLDIYKGHYGNAGLWKDAQIYKVTCEPERCTVRTRLTVTTMLPAFSRSIPEITSYIDEVWVRDDGRWWYYEGAF